MRRMKKIVGLTILATLMIAILISMTTSVTAKDWTEMDEDELDEFTKSLGIPSGPPAGYKDPLTPNYGIAMILGAAITAIAILLILIKLKNMT